MYSEVHGIDRFDVIMNNLRIFSKLVKNKNFHVKIKGPFLSPASVINEDMELFKKKMIDMGFEFIFPRLHNFGKLDIAERTIPTKPCYISVDNPWLTVTWDMNVVPCCVVVDNEIVLGNLRERPLKEIWYGEAWKRFRRASREMQTREQYPFCWRCTQDGFFGYSSS